MWLLLCFFFLCIMEMKNFFYRYREEWTEPQKNTEEKLRKIFVCVLHTFHLVFNFKTLRPKGIYATYTLHTSTSTALRKVSVFSILLNKFLENDFSGKTFFQSYEWEWRNLWNFYFPSSVPKIKQNDAILCKIIRPLLFVNFQKWTQWTVTCQFREKNLFI